MSQILSDITLTLNKASAVDLGGYPPSNIGWIILINASPYALHATIGSNAVNVPAWYYYPAFVDGRLTGGVSVTPYLQTIPGSGFTKTLSTILYERHELPDNISPQPLGGGPVDLTTATNILNTGNPVGTNIVFAQPLADTDPAGAVKITNSGLAVIGDTINSGKVLVSGTHVSLAANNNIFPDEINIVGTSNQQIDLLISGSDATATLENQAGTSIVKLQTTSPALDLGGSNGAKSILVGNNKPIQSKDSGGTARDILYLDGANATDLQSVTGSELVNIKKSDGTTKVTFNNTNGTIAASSQNVHLVGTTAGSIDMYQDFTGDIKRVVLVFNGYRNASATPQVMAIPTPFTKGAQMMIGNINCTMACLASSVAQNINHYANGAQTVATSVAAGNTAECATAFDSVSFVSSGASVTTCIVTLLGF